MKINKAKILNTVKTVGKYSLYLLSRKATWVAIASGISYLFTQKDEAGNLVVDEITQGNVEYILHGLEVITCALLDGCS
ncbi:hypothetical protein ERHA55_29430 [Erwinia rhapontici]|uniref:Uncharacterized protein n=1 Tax=Erwinia rhapontici TaxID=55212 RepID=A0ABN6DQA2_ERWRD|nr:hypothetical protein [Erwinia rhapontici]BCQ35272.1 hypothetical protein ERHA53_26150 [Erwinia rhapontici]BCQ45416.1 hypothetical protein ERHA55_29430 [Erwinia rhapontici]